MKEKILVLTVIFSFITSTVSAQYFLPEQYIEAEDGDLATPMQTGTNTTASGG
jgi:hypothetical protein